MNSSTRTKYKGLDILLDSFHEVSAKYPDAKLYLLGDNDQNPDNKNIISTGFKSGEEFANLLSQMQVGAWIARGDTFPVGSIEAMLAGVPTFVSQFTGTKAIVEKANPNFILPISSKELSSNIIKYFKLPDNKKEKLAKKFREVARPYLVRNSTKTFPKKFKMLVEKIKKKRKSKDN